MAMYKNQNVRTLGNHIESAEVSENAKVFSNCILNVNQNHYTEEEKWLSQCLFYRSTAGYKKWS